MPAEDIRIEGGIGVSSRWGWAPAPVKKRRHERCPKKFRQWSSFRSRRGKRPPPRPWARRSAPRVSISWTSARTSTRRRRRTKGSSSPLSSPCTRTGPTRSSQRRRRRPSCSTRGEHRQGLARTEQDEGRHRHGEAGGRHREAEDAGLNAESLEAAVKTVAGTARSMGLDVIG